MEFSYNELPTISIPATPSHELECQDDLLFSSDSDDKSLCHKFFAWPVGLFKQTIDSFENNRSKVEIRKLSNITIGIPGLDLTPIKVNREIHFKRLKFEGSCIVLFVSQEKDFGVLEFLYLTKVAAEEGFTTYRTQELVENGMVAAPRSFRDKTATSKRASAQRQALFRERHGATSPSPNPLHKKRASDINVMDMSPCHSAALKKGKMENEASPLHKKRASDIMDMSPCHSTALKEGKMENEA